MTNVCKKHMIVVSVGSNSDARKNVAEASSLFSKYFEKVFETTAIETDPVGVCVSNASFVNCILVGITDKGVDETTKILKLIESECGDTRHNRNTGIVIADLDLLEYDNTRFHKHDWERTYIVKLMSEVYTNIKKR